ncbi:hypothetical protein GOB57_07920 [Sinorhizobium meliloti]|nr:hypothetical protein [Sinorhizobium meliloti]
MARYLVSDYPLEAHGFENNLWHHIFERGGGEQPVRFVYDKQNEEIVFAMIRGGTTVKEGEAEEWWAELSPDGAHDVQESIRDNLGFVESAPELYPDAKFGLIETDELPEWAGDVGNEPTVASPSP